MADLPDLTEQQEVMSSVLGRMVRGFHESALNFYVGHADLQVNVAAIEDDSEQLSPTQRENLAFSFDYMLAFKTTEAAAAYSNNPALAAEVDRLIEERVKEILEQCDGRPYEYEDDGIVDTPILQLYNKGIDDLIDVVRDLSGAELSPSIKQSMFARMPDIIEAGASAPDQQPTQPAPGVAPLMKLNP